MRGHLNSIIALSISIYLSIYLEIRIYQSYLPTTHIPSSPTPSLPPSLTPSLPHSLPPDIIRLTSPRDGQTALHRAASSDQHDIVSLLLTEDPLCANIQDKEGNTALHLACRKAHKRIVNTLLVKGIELLANLE